MGSKPSTELLTLHLHPSDMPVNSLPPAAHFCSSDGEAGKGARILGHALLPPRCRQKTQRPRQAVLTSWAALAGSPQCPLHRRPRAAAPAPAVRPPVLPWQPGQWHWLPECACRAHRVLVTKGSHPGFPHQLPVLLPSLIHPLGKHSPSAKVSCILLVPPASPKDRGALGRAQGLCSNWISKGKTLIPKILLNHIQLHPQRQLGSKDNPAAASSPAPGLVDVKQNPPKRTFWAPSRISVLLPSLLANSGSNSPVCQSQSLLGQQQELIGTPGKA